MSSPRPGQVRLRIGVALQDAALDDRQTGRELLRLQGRLYGLRSAEIRRRVEEVLDLVAIGAAIDRRIGTYSGGMRRRLDLAAALVHNPEVVFLDEPTTGLDPDSRARVWAEVRKLNQSLGITIFLTTQYLEEADALAHRVGFISAGRLVAEGRPEQLKQRIGSELIVADVSGDGSHRPPTPGGLGGSQRRVEPRRAPRHLHPRQLLCAVHGRDRARPKPAHGAEPHAPRPKSRRRVHRDHRLTPGPGPTMTSDGEIRGRPAGFGHDLATIVGRALRDIPREPTAVLTAIFLPAFFYLTNIGALRECGPPRRRLQLQSVSAAHGHRLRGNGHVEGSSPGHRHPRRLLRSVVHDAGTPPRPAAGAHGRRRGGDRRPVPASAGHRLRAGCALRHGRARSLGLHRVLGAVGTRLHWYPLRRGTQDRKPGRGQCGVHRFLPPVLLERRTSCRSTPLPGGSQPSLPTTRSPT